MKLKISRFDHFDNLISDRFYKYDTDTKHSNKYKINALQFLRTVFIFNYSHYAAKEVNFYKKMKGCIQTD